MASKIPNSSTTFDAYKNKPDSTMETKQLLTNELKDNFSTFKINKSLGYDEISFKNPGYDDKYPRYHVCAGAPSCYLELLDKLQSINLSMYFKERFKLYNLQININIFYFDIILLMIIVIMKTNEFFE